MSSAALQTAPHQSTTVGSHSPVTTASSNRPFTAGSSQSREQYYNQSSANASPSLTRWPSRRPSGNGASSSNNTPQAQYYFPSASTGTAPIPSRGSNASNTASPATASPTGFPVMAPGDHQRGVPPVVSPRTSSTSRTTNAAVAAASAAERGSSSRRTGYTNEERSTNSPRPGEGYREINGMAQTNGTDRERGKDEATAAAASAASRSRRRGQQPSGEALPHRPSGSREQRGQPSSAVPARMTSAGQSSPNGPSRQSSEVMNRVIISKPEVDIARERERTAEAIPTSPTSQASPIGQLSVVGSEGIDDNARGHRSRQDHSSSKREKHSRFGEYFLGNTLGEGEFGKVKMGWKQEGGVQVAIKLIRRDSVGTNPTRLAKIYREIAILREISHPNIVRLHEMVETEKQIGIILEYASGGELFDFILNHRYLKDNQARRLFAQLVSGVGYLHKKGIVHRDLKLENLLLDRNRNIIITDFGFANTFDPCDELGEDVEMHLNTRDFIKRMELDKLGANGFRRGDLMQTSCGSPCYAAPELVVSDSLYTGRKVDVWSCGVILYAMLAGYLPFDDDPANPEGDNINLLYKYIVSTPLTFPEYVTPHARDLLRRILVPDPRKRADLFEVARHSWLSEFHHVVGFITSSTSTTGDIANAMVPAEDEQGTPLLARSASVREPSKTPKSPPNVGDLARKHGNVDQEAEGHPKVSKDNKRRTVQVEYVAPKSQTQRGETSATGAKTRARSGSQGPVEVQQSSRAVSTEKPLPRDPPVAKDTQYQGRRPSSSQRQQGMPPLSGIGRPPPRSVSETAYLSGGQSNARPNTQGSNRSIRSGSVGVGGRGTSYSQPAAPAVADTNAHGRMSQPKYGKNYNMSQQDEREYGKTSPSNVPSKFAKVAGFPEGSVPEKSHRRSDTLGSLFGRTNSIFGRSNADKSEKPNRKYPPVSMSGAANIEDARQSIDSSRRSISFGFGRKRSGSITGNSQKSKSSDKRRFSLLPNAISKAIGLSKEPGTPTSQSEYEQPRDSRDGYPDPPNNRDSRNVSGSTDYTAPHTADGSYVESPKFRRDRRSSVQNSMQNSVQNSPQTNRQSYYAPYTSQSRSSPKEARAPPQFLPPLNFRQGESSLNTDSETSLNMTGSPNTTRCPAPAQYPQGFNEYEDPRRVPPQSSSSSQPGGRQGSSAGGGRGLLQKNNRKFVDAYEPDNVFGGSGGGGHGDNAASSGAARKVMDFFRRRGKARGE